MIPRDKRQAPQRDLLETYLEDILNPRHELVQMGKRIDWAASKMPEHLLADRGYRGSESTFLSQVHITGKQRGRGKAHSDQQHRRNSIESIIGHLKSALHT